MTPELYNYFMNLQDATVAAGEGFYVAEDLASSSRYGASLIQVELEPGYKYLDLTDPDIYSQFKKNGISEVDVYNLNPRIAVKYSGHPWWVLKGQEGVKFKPFSSREISLDTLGKAYDEILDQPQKSFFKDAIKKDVLKRAKKNSFVLESPFVDIVEEAYGRQYVQEAVKSHIASRPAFRALSDGIGVLNNAGKYLSRTNKKRIIDMVKKIPSKNIQESADFLKYAKDVLSDTDVRKIVDNTPIIKGNKSILLDIWYESSLLMKYVGESLSEDSLNKFVEKLIPHIDSYEFAVSLLSKTASLSPQNKKKIIDKAISLIRNSEYAEYFLRDYGEYLGKTDRKKLWKKLSALFTLKRS